MNIISIKNEFTWYMKTITISLLHTLQRVIIIHARHVLLDSVEQDHIIIITTSNTYYYYIVNYIIMIIVSELFMEKVPALFSMSYDT